MPKIEPKFITIGETNEIIREEILNMKARCEGLAERCETTTEMREVIDRELAEAQRRTLERLERLRNVAMGGGNA